MDLLLLGIFLFVFGGLFTYLLTVLFIRWSRERNILDIPNERSSHTIPVPRGAGIIFTIICLAGYSSTAFFYPNGFHLSVVIAGSAIALMGWLDDLYSIPRTLRFAVQFICGALLIYKIGYFDLISLGSDETSLFLGLAGIVLTICWFIWTVNAFNFMDGIDGITAGTSVASTIAWMAFGYYFSSVSVFSLSAVCCGACLGFLIHNWHPARVFMGDVGSSFLGFVFAVLPIIALSDSTADRGRIPIFALTAIWPFIFDTIFTFFRRLPKLGLSVWRPHRTHIYQIITDSGYVHERVSLLYIALTLLTGLAGLIFLYLTASYSNFFLFLPSVVSILLAGIYVKYRNAAMIKE